MKESSHCHECNVTILWLPCVAVYVVVLTYGVHLRRWQQCDCTVWSLTQCLSLAGLCVSQTYVDRAPMPTQRGWAIFGTPWLHQTPLVQYVEALKRNPKRLFQCHSLSHLETRYRRWDMCHSITFSSYLCQFWRFGVSTPFTEWLLCLKWKYRI